MRTVHPSFPTLIALLLLTVEASTGCDDARDAAADTFASDIPRELQDRIPSQPGDGDGDAPPIDGDDPLRPITEADIVQVAAGKLYALSRYGGMQVFDISEPGTLERLGGFVTAHDAEPFELYIRDGLGLVMYRGWGQYERNDDDGYAWTQTSKLLALDVRYPHRIVQLGSFSVPGAISDSRLVGDILYVVSYQDGGCWACESGKPLTAVTSFDVSTPASLRKVSELRFEDDDNAWGSGRRSVHVAGQRMYVAGVEYGEDGPVGSTIRVIDISSPSGELTESASIEAEGQITSRWQIDEHDGVLRVLSQPPDWDLQAPPVIQTFRIESSARILPLGRATLSLPRPEQLQSVRFDGPRAYAITFERTDPLFTIDLSDPEHPVQRGTLQMPGFVYHMEPRGDRVIGLGFDQGSASGSITVSTFDVSDMTDPRMLSRVGFGGSWASLPEDQDRIHKVFRVLDALGLILVPYSGWSEIACGTARSGVQIVDYDVGDGTLALRASLESRGAARRALIVDDSLFTVSDERVERYDITDRDAPDLSGSAALTRNVTRTVPLASGRIARVSQDPWSSDSLLIDVVDAAEVGVPESATNELAMGELLRATTASCDASVWLEDAFALGERLAVVYRSLQRDEGIEHGYGGLLLIDASGDAGLDVLSRTEWRFDYGWWSFSDFYDYGMPSSRSAIVHTEDAVVLLEGSYRDGQATRWLRVIDVREPESPVLTTMEVAVATGQGGLLVDGEVIVSSHYELEGEAGVARFFIDRVDVSEPSAPRRLPPINVPGTVLHLDSQAGRALTAELTREPEMRATWQECFDRFATFEYEAGTELQGTCTGYRQHLRLLEVSGDGARLIDSFALDRQKALRSTAMGSGVFFATAGTGAYRGWLAADCWGPCGYGSSEPSTLLTFSGIDHGALQVGQLELDDEAWWGWWSPTPIYAFGKRVLVVGQDDALIVSATDPMTPTIRQVELLGGYVQHVATTATDAFLALGPYGARSIEVIPTWP